MNRNFKIKMGFKIVGGIILFTLVFGFGTMYLWNWLVPTLFHGPVINFWQTLGLIALSKLLFGFGKGGFGKKHHRHHMHWNPRMAERFKNMTPEEQEEFKERFKERCRGRYWKNEGNTNDQSTL